MDLLSLFVEIGDYVEQDEEIATIETDKVRAVFTMPISFVATNSINVSRLMSPSTRPKQARSKNSSQTRKIRSPWDKTF